MDRRFIVILVAVIAIIGGLFFITRDRASSPSANNGDNTSASTSSHSLGAGTASVELVEYGDFQCPACGGFYPIIKQLEEKYGDQIKFTFRHFPIDNIHPNARAAHRSAEAAGIQGKFFEMHDLLYTNQNTWKDLTNPVPLFEDYATQLGLNLEKFKADFSSQAVNDTINADVRQGKDEYDANSTPTFILNGQKLENGEVGSIELFSTKIDAAIEAAKKPQ